MAIRYGADLFWWAHFEVIAAPSVLATLAATLHLLGKGKLRALESTKIRMAILTVVLAAPLLFVALTWYFFTMLN
jgi:hypothetical protein